MLCGSLDGRAVWERRDTCICMAESLHYSHEAITTLLIGYTPIQNKKFVFFLKSQSQMSPPQKAQLLYSPNILIHIRILIRIYTGVCTYTHG